MAPTQPTSAVIVRVPLPRRLAAIRARRDWAASVGVPSHVTILYPFVPAAKLVPALRQALVEIACDAEPFTVRFERVGRFPRVVYLAPEPAAPFSALTDAVRTRFPDYPPYDGAFEEVIPHLTIIETPDPGVDETMLGSIAVLAARDLPFGARIDRLEVLVEGADGRWSRRWRMALGRQGG